MGTKLIGKMTAKQFVSQCANCKHKALGNTTCAAFPIAIPDKILSGHFDHRFPFEGDGGIRFDPVDDENTP